MTLRTLAPTAALLALTACGPGAPETGAAKIDADNRTASIDIGGSGQVATLGMKAPDALPAYAPAYPGATIQSAVTQPKEAGGGGMMVFTTPDPVEKVVAYYVDAVARSGAGKAEPKTIGALQMLEMNAGEKSLSLSIAPQGANTFVQMNWR